MFFVISGYVITGSLKNRTNARLGEFLLHFYMRRAKRLLPALVLCIILGSTLICFFNPSPINSLRTGLTALFGVSNIYLLRQATDYFGSAAELNIFSHTWSLGVEEQFYFFFPIILWLTGYGRLSNKGSKVFLWVMVPLSLVSLYSFVQISKLSQPSAYFLMPTRWWELALGSLVFVGGETWIAPHLSSRAPPSSFTLAAVLAVLFIPLQLATSATIAAVGLTAMLIGSLRPGTIVYRFLTLDNVVYIGKVSYSLYLWHWLVICLSRWTIGIHWWSLPFQVPMMMLFAAASYKYIESPLRRIEWSRSSIVAAGYGVATLSICAIYVFCLDSGRVQMYTGKNPSGTPDYFSANADPERTVSSEFDGTVFLIGDSHAAHFDQMVQSVAKNFKMDYRLATKSATPYPTLRIPSPASGLTRRKSIRENLQMKERVEELLEDSSSKDLIVLSSFYQYYFATPLGSRRFKRVTHYDKDGRVISKDQALSSWLEDLEDFALKHADTPIAIILSTPEVPGIYREELSAKEWFRPVLSEKCTVSIPRTVVIDELKRINQLIFDKSQVVSNLHAFDPLPSLCPLEEEFLHSHQDGIRLFKDEDHLTGPGSAKVLSNFQSFLYTFTDAVLEK